MAISLIGTSQSGGSTNGGNVTLTFDVGTPPLENDIVWLMGGLTHNDTGSNVAGPNTAGYTQLAKATDTITDEGIWYKVMGSTPDLTVEGNGSAVVTDSTAYMCFTTRGVSLTAPNDDVAAVQVTELVDGSASDTPSITTVTDGAWVVSYSAVGLITFGEQIGQNTAQPSGYTTIILTQRANDNRDIRIGCAYKAQVSAGAEDPGIWTDELTAPTHTVGWTFAIRDASATPPSGGGTTSPNSLRIGGGRFGNVGTNLTTR